MKDWLGEIPKFSERPQGRVVRLLTDGDEEEAPSRPDTGRVEPEIIPFLRVTEKGEVLTTKGDQAMPRGVYERKKKTGGERSPPRRPPPSRKRASPRRLKGKPVTIGARFGVFDDGSVQINTATCSGTLSSEDAAALVAFIGGRSK